MALTRKVGEMSRVLVVDDDKTLCGLIEYKLKKKGYDVRIGLDGLEARALLESERFDALILDIMMPKMDGFHLLRVLQNSAETAPTVTVVLSARNEEEDILRAFELGAVDYVTKPFSIDVLVARVGVALQHKVPRG